MELLGKNLRQFRKLFPNKRVPISVTCYIANQILNFIEYMHSKGFLYVDIKPENFMVAKDIDRNEPKIYCADFGLSQKYIINGKHRPLKNVSRVGTLNFMSIHNECKILPSRRDDIESLMYVILFLLNGNLPWEYATTDDYGYKMKYHYQYYVGIIPDQIKEIITYVRNMEYDEQPDYDYIRKILNELSSPEQIIKETVDDILDAISTIDSYEKTYQLHSY